MSDEPGSVKALVETLVAHNVNVLVHEGVTESTEQGRPVHQVHEILDLAKYSDVVDGASVDRNSVTKPQLKPNRLISRLISHADEAILQTRGRDAWEMRLGRMEFFFRNKEWRDTGVELIVNVNNEIHVPTKLLREMALHGDPEKTLALHIISDTEQKYVKLRVLSPARYYLLMEIEHAEQVGAIDDFMMVLRSHKGNMIDSYSRLKSIAHSALFYALVEFTGKLGTRQVLSLVKELLASEHARAVVLKEAFGAGPSLDKLEPQLPTGAKVRTEARSKAARQRAVEHADAKRLLLPETEPRLGRPYYLDRQSSDWELNTAEVFMAIPFAKSYEDFYEDFIAAAVRDAGLEPVRVDRMRRDARRRTIIDRIEEGIARSRFVLADVSLWNPNVVYEVGLAVGISKPVLLLCDEQHFNPNEIPFDFRAYELIEYSPYQAGNLRRRLAEVIGELKSATDQ